MGCHPPARDHFKPHALFHELKKVAIDGGVYYFIQTKKRGNSINQLSYARPEMPGPGSGQVCSGFETAGVAVRALAVALPCDNDDLQRAGTPACPSRVNFYPCGKSVHWRRGRGSKDAIIWKCAEQNVKVINSKTSAHLGQEGV